MPVTEIHAAPMANLRVSPEKWQMGFHERMALEGILSQLKPSLAIEIGTAHGGSLERIAAHCQEVHSIELSYPIQSSREVRSLSNVTFHRGDSHKLLPRLLKRLEGVGRNVDFALVDGDHSSEGVKLDVEDLLGSAALQNGVVLVHDTMNETVRAGLEQIDYEDFSKVRYVELDFVPGHLFRESRLLHQLWFGLGLILVDSGRPGRRSAPIRQDRYYEHHDVFRRARPLIMQAEREYGKEREPSIELLEGEIILLEEELARCKANLDAVLDSVSWRLTAPLRLAKARLKGVRPRVLSRDL
jgi:hypothetical protein